MVLHSSKNSDRPASFTMQVAALTFFHFPAVASAGCIAIRAWSFVRLNIGLVKSVVPPQLARVSSVKRQSVRVVHGSFCI